MERTMSVEDKIRRAEEIYNRRRESEYRVKNTRVSVDKKDTNNQKINKKLKKMIIQIIVCMLIYLFFHYIINNNYIFSQDVKNKCREILDYDISFSQMYNKVSACFLEFQQKINNGNEEINAETQKENVETQSDEGQEEVQGDNEQEQNVENIQNEAEVIQPSEQVTKQTDENIGGAIEKIENEEIAKTDEPLTEDEQMKKDAEDIKSTISFIKPLSGVITSVFGWRNPKVSTVSKYHTGIDIATDEGVEIISATNGKVELASSEGAYGNHLKIVIDDVTIIYAHCSSLLVKQGDEILQGQTIAKVGSTGNSTGPHLHFEIRKQDRYVDPSLILEF